MKVPRRTMDDFCSHCGELKRTSSKSEESTPSAITEMHAGIVEDYATKFPLEEFPPPEGDLPEYEGEPSTLQTFIERVAAEAIRRSVSIIAAEIRKQGPR